MTDRRAFLKGILALSVAPMLPAISIAAVPGIWGDGVHDDAPGLNALFAGEPFSVEGSGFIARDGIISNGSFFLGSPLMLNSKHFLITRSVFHGPCEPMLSVGPQAKGAIMNCIFRTVV